MNDRPRIKDIAARVGVSAATVSRALNRSPLIAADTSARIRAVAAEMGYRPNVSARNLRTRRSMAVLVVVRDMSNPFYLEVFAGAEAAARAAGYAVLMGNIEGDSDREAEYFRMLDDGHADGMILMTGRAPPPSALRGGADRKVVVALETIAGTDFPRVLIDNAGAAAQAVAHLTGLGHRRVAHVTGPLSEAISRERLDGYRLAMHLAGLTIPPGHECEGDFSLASGEACARSLLALQPRPTAIFAANDEMAFGIIREIRRQGLAVPQDISVVGFDDIYLSEAFLPPLTTISQPRRAIGRRTMAVLIDMMAGGAPPAAPIILPTELVRRESTTHPRPGPTGLEE